MSYNVTEVVGNPEEDLNSPTQIGKRVVLIGVILSCAVYLKYTFKSLHSIHKTHNWKFIFPLVAALFASTNNLNDIFFYVYKVKDCALFYKIFLGSATLNWIPISWLQSYRLSFFSKCYLKKSHFIGVTITTVILSTVYSVFYLLNLSEFGYGHSEVMGCTVKGSERYIYWVMISDIVDSTYSLGIICFLIYKNLCNLKEIRQRNERLSKLLSNGISDLIILTSSKIVVYPLISLTTEIPSFDVFWDVLSVIVIICSYNLVNFPYKAMKLTQISQL